MDREWYVLRVQSGREEKVKSTLKRKIQLAGLEDQVTNVLVPTENVTEIKGGRKRIRERKLYPGYIMVEMELADDVWFVIRDTPGIGDFVGAYGRPVPMRPEEVSRILEGQQEKEEHIVLTEGSIKDVIDTAVQMCETSAREKNVTVDHISKETLRANINRDLLVQAVVNLLDNAIKYSDPGSQVRVRGGQKGADVVISVKDFGPGIPKEHLARLFERFYRIDKARSREVGGTGLGLAIVKHIATAHHGYATVKSTVGKGSTFSIRLPLQ